MLEPKCSAPSSEVITLLSKLPWCIWLNLLIKIYYPQKKTLQIHLLFVCEVKVAWEKCEQFPLTTTSFQRYYLITGGKTREIKAEKPEKCREVEKVT